MFETIPFLLLDYGRLTCTLFLCPVFGEYYIGCDISPGRYVFMDLKIVPNIERGLRSFRSAEYIPGFELIRFEDKH
jgi:hypothetical protein